MKPQPFYSVMALHVGLVGLLVAPLSRLQSADWPQYRGLYHDGSSREPLRTNWAEQPPAIVWKKQLGPGWSSITASGGRVYTQVKRSNREFCVALSADTGAELW